MLQENFSYISSIYYSSPDYCTQIIDGKELTYDNNALLIPKKYISEIINQLIKLTMTRILILC